MDNNKIVLKKLIKKPKNNEKLISCILCTSTFTDHNEYIEHYRLHGKKHIDIYGRLKNNKNNYKNSNGINESSDSNEKDNEFEKNDTKTVNNTKPIGLIECEWCSEVFPNISRAIQHKYRQHKNMGTNYFCKLCGKLFPLKYALDQHNKLEHPNNDDSNQPIEHKKSTTTTSTTTRSTRRATTATTTTSSVKVENVLNNPNNSTSSTFNCSYCTVTFATLEASKTHENDAHRIERGLVTPRTIMPPPSKKIKINNSNEMHSLYYCYICGCEYMLKYNLQKHLETSHTEGERCGAASSNAGLIQCKACDAIFYTEKAYLTHNLYHKEDDLYVISEEHRQKVVGHVDQDFDIRRVPAIKNNKLAKPNKRKRKY